MLNQPIADRMTVQIVDRLEPVEIDDEQSDRPRFI